MPLSDFGPKVLDVRLGSGDGAPMTDQPIFAIDRAILATRRALVALVKFHIATGFAVQIEDTHLTGDDQLRYEIRLLGNALQLVDIAGRQIGVFSDIVALVDHAETITSV